MNCLYLLRSAFLVVCLFVGTGQVVNSLASGDGATRINPDLLTKSWSARWITMPNASPFDYGVYHFRRTFDLQAKPSSFVIHVTGDNRYQLFINGQASAWGPARGDLNHWRFETIDIAPYLKAGKNVIAAVVWNFGQYAPESQVTERTAFLLQGDTTTERVVDTNTQWKCIRNTAYQPLSYTHSQMRGYFVAGPGDKVDGGAYPWGWQQPEFDDSTWNEAQTDGRWRGAPRDSRDSPNRWLLVPRNIPLMEEKPERFASVRQSTGVSLPTNFPLQSTAFTIPANTTARLLLDQSHLTTAFPELIVSRGKGAVIQLGYAESLFAPGTQRGKGNRNEVEGKEFVGYYDSFTSDGGNNRMFRPLWWRTYRYVELKIETKGEPLTIEDLRGVYTGYPFEMKAKFDAGSERLDKILEIGWHTARLCAHETYMDCPYYEQLQYVGDTRIQCLVSLYNSGDARLMKNAIAQINDSRTAEGATMSRAPTRQQQYIPPFSLWWIGMVHDYWRYQDDAEFVREMLPGVRGVLDFFARRQQPNGSLGKMPWWNYADWAWRQTGGVPPNADAGSSATIDLQLLLALDWAADLEDGVGSKRQAAEFREAAGKLRATIKQIYWDSSRQLFADTPDKKEYSQQANSLAVLAHAIEGDDARALVKRILNDSSLTQCTYYFRHYLHSAVNMVGEGDRYLDLLGEWDKMLELGLTTWAETPEPSRSDCHAWSSSPNYELFRTVLGIDSAAPGFNRVIIRPYLGKLTQASGSIPHPKGEIAVSLKLVGGKLNAEVRLPHDVTGEFVWRGSQQPLKAGLNKLSLNGL